MPTPSAEQFRPSAEQESLAHALEMARPRRRRDQKPVELTPDQDKLISDLIDRAKDAEKAGDKIKAIELYKECEAELDKIKEVKRQEKRKGEFTKITAENPEGEPIEFDFHEIREHWASFYKEHNLEEMADNLPETISLSQEQKERIQELSKEGYNCFIMFPENADKYLTSIKDETEKQMPGLKEEEGDNQQYDESEGTYLGEDVEEAFPDKISTQNRPESAYLLMIKNTPEVDEETRDKTADDLRELFKEKGLHGLTLTEYLIFQRDYTKRHIDDEKPHPDTSYITWLLDSELASSQVLEAFWDSGGRQVRVDSNTSGFSDVDLGCRSSAVLEI